MKNYSLIVTIPDADPILYELRGERVGLGRELDNQIRLQLNQVSSSHCEFRRLEGGGYEVVDLDSTNGTRVNGKVIEKLALADGDRLLIGEMVAAHFVELAEGEIPVDVAVEAGAEGQRAAASYTEMDKKLQAIEETIAVKSSELEALQEEHDEKMAEYGRMAAHLESLEEEIEQKREAAGGNDTAEIRKLEMDLLKQTRKVHVMRTDLDGKAQQLREMQAGSPAPVTPGVAVRRRLIAQPVVPVPMSASPHAQAFQDDSTPPAETNVEPPPPQEPAPPVVHPVVEEVRPAGPKTRALMVDTPETPKAKLRFGNRSEGS